MARESRGGDTLRGELLNLVVFVCANSGLSDKVSSPVKEARVRPVVMPCSSKNEAHVILKAFETGADGVLVVACPLGQCRFVEGNRRAERRLGYVRGLLDEIGLSSKRLDLVFADSKKGGQPVRSFASKVAKLGPTGIKSR